MPEAPHQPALRADARRNVEKLRKAAADAFSAHGLDTPLETIAKLAGVSVGTIYNRFGNRDALMDQVVNELADRQVRAAMAIADGTTGSAWDRLLAYIEAICQSQADDPAFNDAFSRRYPNAPALKAVCDRSLVFATELAAGARAEGALREDAHMDDIARFFQVNGDLVRAGDDAGRRRVLALLFEGLRARPGSRPLPD
ncbi:TetR/AcrR family transcriptional regulator [Streptomyces xanthochromogenes]|uniref:TetR family transcriptional regulator n=1 Tax=Streptomyces xanthochromogenes TaxID=67384 RepID=A0ABQ2ZEX6_9ACTN|nr:TetR/AcrR family transcriptional regulator [Streptomyces xanthochromogenes]GGY14487.1 TetR family transcriptional regulator [Streptomyces xanthochromogenes]